WRQRMGSSPANELTKKPSGAPESKRTLSERSRFVCPGPGQMTWFLPLASPPRRRAMSRRSCALMMTLARRLRDRACAPSAVSVRASGERAARCRRRSRETLLPGKQLIGTADLVPLLHEPGEVGVVVDDGLAPGLLDEVEMIAQRHCLLGQILGTAVTALD